VADWSRSVAGRRPAIESKPLELLRELLIHRGSVVTKDELLDRIWRDVTVVEASLPTAVHKIRLAIGDSDRCHPLIETVPGIGYRLAASVAVDCEQSPTDPTPSPDAQPAGRSRALWRRWGLAAAALAATALLADVRFGPVLVLPRQARATTEVPTVSRRDALLALRNLDIDAVRHMIAAGWDVNRPLDTDGNTAVNLALEICEWDPGHDRHRLLMLVRLLADEGASMTRRNKWGDTAYSIAAAPRYCGPDHPVTRLIGATCSSGNPAIDPACLASYVRDRQKKA
jgi:DNA-binding winged helix-turn-helix (wHTH) protein